MRQSTLTKILLVAICSLYLARCSQLATMGTKFRLVHGQEHDNGETTIEKSIALHRCGHEKSCSHVARLKQGGRITLINELTELKGKVVDALWKKEQPGEYNSVLHIRNIDTMDFCFHLLGF